MRRALEKPDQEVLERLSAIASPTRFEILRNLENGALSFTALSESLGTSGPALVHHLTRLVRAGLVQKKASSDPNSRVYRMYSITDVGKETLKRLVYA